MGSAIADGRAHRLVVRRLQPVLQIALQSACTRFLVLADGRMIFGNGLPLFLIPDHRPLNCQCARGAETVTLRRASNRRRPSTAVSRTKAFRKGIDGLVALVRDAGSDPFLCVGRDYVAEAP
ncbi:hypothetical protein DXU06_27580 [Bradyrhizobium elkanii]|nr:transposase [Bradyrhizobium elkanii]QOZ20493.1 hypothetical protein XI02_39970 [Bradyrhizobium sp. CCBAU 21365]RYM33134.1 hypothetical protein EWH13_01490 [Bradyrhizobium elkanii]